MQDIIFGTLISDELKLIHHRAHRTGLQHNYAIDPMDPKPGQPVAVFARVGSEIDLDEVSCHYTLDGSQPVASNGSGPKIEIARLVRIRVEWDTLTWGYVETWRGEIPAQAEGTLVRYKIAGLKNGKIVAFADWPG